MNKTIPFLLLLMATSPQVYPLPSEEHLVAVQSAAEQGDAKAQFELATAYFQGIGVEQDYQQAFKWYQKAAQQGMPAAQHNLGHIYSQGLGVAVDDEQAIYWYRKAAKQGDWRAQNSLGNAYRLGKGVAQDAQQAVKWYQKAAEQGYAVAQNNLALAYSQGQGVARNLQQAIKWYQKAAEQGYAEAHSNLLTLLKHHTVAPEQPTESKPPSKLETPSIQRDDLGRYTIALHYARSADQSWIQQLAQFLQQQGYQVDHMTQVNMHLAEPQWDIRFYDQPQPAQILKQYLHSFIKKNPLSQRTELDIKNFQFLRKTQKIRQGRLEIWILNPTT